MPRNKTTRSDLIAVPLKRVKSTNGSKIRKKCDSAHTTNIKPATNGKKEAEQTTAIS